MMDKSDETNQPVDSQRTVPDQIHTNSCETSFASFITNSERDIKEQEIKHACRASDEDMKGIVILKTRNNLFRKMKFLGKNDIREDDKQKRYVQIYEIFHNGEENLPKEEREDEETKEMMARRFWTRHRLTVVEAIRKRRNTAWKAMEAKAICKS